MNIISLSEREILDVADRMGAVAESSCHFTSMLATQIVRVKKPLATFTIAELLYSIDRCRVDFNRSLGASDPNKGRQPS